MAARKIDFQAIRDAHPLVDVAARYVDLKRKGHEYVCCCVWHAEKDPSLTFYKGRGGNWRYRCFPCGADGDVIDFVAEMERCSPADAVHLLETGALPAPGSFKVPELPADESECWESILPAPADAPPYDPARTFNPKRGKEVCYRPQRTDAYRDAEGRVLCHVVRLCFDDGKKLCPTITYCVGPGGQRRWCAKRMPPPYPLQGLDALAANPKHAVLVLEGEKKVAAANEHLAPRGFVAVGFLGGVEGVELADVEPLRGRNCTFWPDADDVGRWAMRRLWERIGDGV